MKRLILIMLIFLSYISFSNNELIKEYIVNISVMEDGHLDISEKITYNPGDNVKRGIYRIIPYKYGGSYLKFEDRVKIENFEVSYLDYPNQEVGLSTHTENNLKIYRLGKEDIFLKENTDYIYNLKYKMYNILRMKDGIVQLYFNPIGVYWEIPIDKVIINIKGINGELEAYTGLLGETNKDFNLVYKNGIYTITSTKPFFKGEGLSFVINSKDFNYSIKNVWFNRIKAYPIIIIFPIIFLFSIIINFIIFIHKYLNRIKKSIAIEYLVPKVSPMIAKRIVRKNKYKDLMIVIFLLIEKEIIKYREKNSDHDLDEEYVIKKGEAKPIKIKSYNDYIEKQYYIDMETYENIKNISEEELLVLKNLILVKNDIFYKEEVLQKTEIELNRKINKEYFNKYARNISIYSLFNFIIVIMFVVFNLSYGIDFSSILIFALLMIPTFINGFTVYTYSKEYEKAYLEVKGFEKFLLNVEAKQFKYFNIEEDIIKYFKDILPYALALGLENKYLEFLNGVIKEYNLDKETIYLNTYYYHMLNRSFYSNVVNRSFQVQNTGFKGSFSSSGYSGGGFGGGGGRSW